MQELTSIMSDYGKCGHAVQFIIDYLSIRDSLLESRKPTSENLDNIMPGIKAGLRAKLTNLK